jgi:hypothetical protein
VDSHIWKDALSVQYFGCFKHIPQVCFVMTERLCLSVGRGVDLLSHEEICVEVSDACRSSVQDHPSVGRKSWRRQGLTSPVLNRFLHCARCN